MKNLPITSLECSSMQNTISYLDYVPQGTNYSSTKRRLRRDLKIDMIVDDIDNIEKVEQLEFEFPDIEEEHTSLSLFSKTANLVKSIQQNYLDYDESIINIEKSLNKTILSEIKSLCCTGKLNFLNRYGLNCDLKYQEDFEKKIMYKIITCSNMIATTGRIGPANSIIASYKYSKYLSDYLPIHHNVIYDDSCGNTIFVYRNDDITHSGLKFLYHIDNRLESKIVKVNYEIVEIGKNPWVGYICFDII